MFLTLSLLLVAAAGSSDNVVPRFAVGSCARVSQADELGPSLARSCTPMQENSCVLLHTPALHSLVHGWVPCIAHFNSVQVAKAHMDLDQWDESLSAFKKARLVRGENTGERSCQTTTSLNLGNLVLFLWLWSITSLGGVTRCEVDAAAV